MIILKGIWECFHCGHAYPNTILHCPECNASKKHTENMKRSLGMEASPSFKPSDVKAKREECRNLQEKYTRIKGKFEAFVTKFFRFAFKLQIFKDKDKNVKKAEDSLYYGFSTKEYHYTIRRDKI